MHSPFFYYVYKPSSGNVLYYFLKIPHYHTKCMKRFTKIRENDLPVICFLVKKHQWFTISWFNQHISFFESWDQTLFGQSRKGNQVFLVFLQAQYASRLSILQYSSCMFVNIAEIPWVPKHFNFNFPSKFLVTWGIKRKQKRQRVEWALSSKLYSHKH